MIYRERVRLRAIERSDFPNFVRWFNDPEVRRYLLMYALPSAEQEEKMLRFAFEELNLHRVELEVFDENARARRCYEKAGFRYEGTRRQAAFFEGRYHDSHPMSVLQEEFL